jgi:uncharacterized membrane protein (UPF0127 family)
MTDRPFIVKTVFAAIACVLLATALFAFGGPRKTEAPTVGQTYGGTLMVGTSTVRLIVADTQAKRVQGLSGHVPLGDDEAMLFIFETPDQWGIWMKDMFFPLDILWLDAEGKVIHAKAGATPESYPEVFMPAEPALYVLEAPAGFAERHRITVGMRLFPETASARK